MASERAPAELYALMRLRPRRLGARLGRRLGTLRVRPSPWAARAGAEYAHSRVVMARGRGARMPETMPLHARPLDPEGCPPRCWVSYHPLGRSLI